MIIKKYALIHKMKNNITFTLCFIQFILLEKDNSYFNVNEV